MGPKWNNFASPENEPEDEGFAGDCSKVLRPWEGVTFREPGGKEKRQKNIQGIIRMIKKYYVCSCLEGEDPERAQNSGQLYERAQHRRKKKYFSPEK